MHRVLHILAMLVLAAIFAGAASAAPLAGKWDRLSVDRSHPAPEHERLACTALGGDGRSGLWGCHYFKLPEPTLGFYWNATHGFFVGTDITGTWTCPAWSRPNVCGNVAQVVHGTATYVQPGVDGSRSVDEDLVVTQNGDRFELHVYWLGPVFECPWFRTFSEAVAANPLPLPFDGTWASQDCVAP